MERLEALLFDVDGTLADTERDGHRVAFNQAFAEAGLEWQWSVDLYGELLAVTGGKERILHFVERYRPDLSGVGDLEGFVADLHRRKTRFFTAALRRGQIPLRPGVARLLREARSAGLRLGIATTTTPANVETLIESTLGAEALDWFAVIAAGDVVPAKKPAPDIYTYALERLGLAPGACVAFEDSAAGVRAALGAGIGTVVVTWNDYTRDQDFTRASLVLDGLGDPGAPCTRVAGALEVDGYLDVPLVQRLHRAAQGGGPVA
jgi:HAD superfamily hydrolase (TIGR01509 family)